MELNFFRKRFHLRENQVWNFVLLYQSERNVIVSKFIYDFILLYFLEYREFYAKKFYSISYYLTFKQEIIYYD